MAADRSAVRQRADIHGPGHPSLGAVPGQTREASLEAAPETDPLELDRLIHERVRLGIVSALAVNGSLSFTELRDLLGTTDGNLSAHARRLEDAGYVVCTKSFEGRTPKTEYALTPTGRRELNGYLDHMEAIIEATRE